MKKDWWLTPMSFSKSWDSCKFVKNHPLQIRIVNRSKHSLPQYATPGSSGLDLRANLEAPLLLKPMERALVPTGIFVEIPQGFEAQVRSRSGLAIRQGVICLNSPGTIDSDYRGEWQVILINLSMEEHTINDGERIAQAVFHKIEQVEWVPVEDINTTERSAGGFGHTGNH